MPTLLRVDGYRLYFYSHEPGEPPHVHIDKAERSAKFWLTPVVLAANVGFPARGLNRLYLLVRLHREQLLEGWYGHFGRPL